MRITISVISAFMLLGTSTSLFAKPTTFRNGGLKYDTVVKLDLAGKTATGTYQVLLQDPEEPFVEKPAEQLGANVLKNDENLLCRCLRICARRSGSHRLHDDN